MPMMQRGKTMYDRYKENGGFIAGPDHAMLNNKRAMAMAGDEGEGEGEEKTPPNLRDAAAESAICGTCEHFEGTGCSKFNGYPVKFHEGCDAHSSLSEEEEDEEEPAEPMEEEDEEE